MAVFGCKSGCKDFRFLRFCVLVRSGSDIIAVVLKANNNRLKPLFPMLEIFQHNIDFIHQVAQLVRKLVSFFLFIPFSQDGKVGVFCQDFELVERNVVIGFYVLVVINICQEYFLAVIKLKSSEARPYYFLYIGSESRT